MGTSDIGEIKTYKPNKTFKLIVNVLFFLIISWSLYPLFFGDPMTGAPGPAALLQAMIGY